MNGVTDGDFNLSDSTRQHLQAYIGSGGDVIIPTSTIEIRQNAFIFCNGLTSVIIPSSVTHIDNQAFDYCSNLTSVTLLSETAPILGAFLHNASGRLFYIPCGSWNSYYNNDSWSGYRNYLREPQAEGVSIYTEVNDSNIGQATANYRPDKVSFVYCDSTAIIEAVAIDSSYHFDHWSNGRIANPDIINLIGDSTVKAIFVPNFCTINMVSDNESFGTVIGSGTFEYGALVSINANAIDHHHFTQCNDGNTENPRTITLTQDTLFRAYFARNIYNVSTVSCNLSMGSVSGGGNIEYLDTVELTATANYGYHFSHWSDGDTNNTRVITPTQDTSLIAYFEKNNYTVTVLSNNNTMGQATGSDTVLYLDSITISASPNYGYHFTHWQDNNNVNPRTVQVTQNKTYTAYFDYNQYSLSLFIDNPIHGSVSGDGNYNYLSNRTITATANYGYHFTHWSDGNTSNPRTISLTQDTSLIAYYERNSYVVTLLSDNTTMGQTIGGDTAFYLDSLTISAIPNYGYHFTHWQDNNTVNPRTVQVTQNKTYTAYFDYNQYSLSLFIDNPIHGSVSGEGTYSYLSNRTINATAIYGYHFSHWSDGDTNNPRAITLTQDTSFTAYFERNSYAVTVLSNNNTMGQATGSDTVLYLDSITISATPNYGYHFIRWQDNNTDNPRVVQVTQNKTYTAYFGYDQFTITVQSDNTIQGNVSGGGSYDYLSNRTITATPNYGYHFTYWNDGVVENPRTITLTQDTSFTAHFAPNQYTLTVTAGEHGTASGSGTYDYGDTIVIQAYPEEHYHFTRWNDGNTSNPRQYRIVEDKTLTAFFAIDTHTVSVVPSDIVRGMVESTGTRFIYGTPCTVTATAYTGYTFAGWSNGVTANPYTFAVISDVELTALFVEEGEEVYTVTVESANPAMGSVSGGGQAMYGGTLTITAIPNEGFRFLTWNDGNTENPRTVTVTENITYTAYFESTTQGINTSDVSDITVYASEGRIIVRGAEGMEMRVFDVIGREVINHTRSGETPLLPSGVYIVKVGTLPARKVVVTR